MTKPVARLTTPAQLVAALPLYLGYVPTESIVVICCHEPRGRLGLTMRYDLPEPTHERTLADDIERRVRQQKATRVVIAVYTEEPTGEELPRTDLVADLSRRFDRLVITERVLIRSQRFWNYACSRPCCPLEGTPVGEARESSAVQVLEAERVLEGRSVMPDRDALEASLAAPAFLEAKAARQRCEMAQALLEDAVDEAGIADAADASLMGWRTALARFQSPPAELADMEAAALAVSLQDVYVRDTLVAVDDRDRTALLDLLRELVRRTPPPFDAAVCTLFAWLSYCDGGGAVTTIALERALRTDSTYSLALLLQSMVLSTVTPAQLRAISERTRDLHRWAS